MPIMQEYLGDGVYAEFDGYHVVLKANSHIAFTDRIALDPHVIRSLKDYFKRLEDQLKEEDHAT